MRYPHVCFLHPLFSGRVKLRGVKKKKKNRDSKSYKIIVMHTKCQGKHSQVTVQFFTAELLVLAGEVKEEKSIKSNSEALLTQLWDWDVP